LIITLAEFPIISLSLILLIAEKFELIKDKFYVLFFLKPLLGLNIFLYLFLKKRETISLYADN